MLKFLLISLFICIGCGPNVDDIELSSCMQGCNNNAKQCLDTANQKLLMCNDDPCQHSVFMESENCLTVCLDCLAACVEKAENNLKN